jgi:hypothetical protein
MFQGVNQRDAHVYVYVYVPQAARRTTAA